MNDEDRIAYEEYKAADAEGRAIYERAKANGLCNIDRWEEGVDHVCNITIGYKTGPFNNSTNIMEVHEE